MRYSELLTGVCVSSSCTFGVSGPDASRTSTPQNQVGFLGSQWCSLTCWRKAPTARSFAPTVSSSSLSRWMYLSDSPARNNSSNRVVTCARLPRTFSTSLRSRSYSGQFGTLCVLPSRPRMVYANLRQSKESPRQPSSTDHIPMLFERASGSFKWP